MNMRGNMYYVFPLKMPKEKLRLTNILFRSKIEYVKGEIYANK